MLTNFDLSISHSNNFDFVTIPYRRCQRFYYQSKRYRVKGSPCNHVLASVKHSLFITQMLLFLQRIKNRFLKPFLKLQISITDSKESNPFPKSIRSRLFWFYEMEGICNCCNNSPDIMPLQDAFCSIWIILWRSYFTLEVMAPAKKVNIKKCDRSPDIY